MIEGLRLSVGSQPLGGGIAGLSIAHTPNSSVGSQRIRTSLRLDRSSRLGPRIERLMEDFLTHAQELG